MAGPVRLLLTRPLAQAQDWSARLAGLGVPTLALPLIDIVAAPDAAPAVRAWAALDRMRLVMFVSPNAVSHFFAHRPVGQAWPAGTLAATVGPGSAQALQAAGVPAHQIVQPPPGADSLDSEHLWPEIQRVAGSDWCGRAALMVRGDGGREWLADRLREAGAQVEAVSVYRRECPRLDAAGQAQLAAVLDQPKAHVWLFSSSEAIGHLEDLAAGVSGAASAVRTPSGPQTAPAAAARAAGSAAPASPESGTASGAGRGPAGAAAGGLAWPDWTAQQAIATHERIASRARALGLQHVVLVRPDAPAVADAFRRWVGTPLESPS